MEKLIKGLFVILFTLVELTCKVLLHIAGAAKSGIAESNVRHEAPTGAKATPKATPMATEHPKKAVTVPSGLDEKVAEPDSLIIKTAMDYLTQADLAVRPPMKVASRILSTPLQTQKQTIFGYAWVYLYEQEGLARRVLKIHDKHLAKLICLPDESRYFFKDVAYDAKKGEVGTNEIERAFISEIQALLNRRGGRKEREPYVVQSAPASAKVESATVQGAPQMGPAPVTPPQPEPVAPIVHKPVNRSVEGEVHIGTVVGAGMTQKTDGKGETYQTFCLTLNDGVREVPLTGAEMMRLCRDQNIRVGDKVKVVDMGRMDVRVPGAKMARWKNLYQLTRV